MNRDFAPGVVMGGKPCGAARVYARSSGGWIDVRNALEGKVADMNAEQQRKSAATESVSEPKMDPAAPKAGRDETEAGPSAPRGQRSWLGDAPTGNEAGTHVVSRIGVCRPEVARRWGHTA